MWIFFLFNFCLCLKSIHLDLNDLICMSSILFVSVVLGHWCQSGTVMWSHACWSCTGCVFTFCPHFFFFLVNLCIRTVFYHDCIVQPHYRLEIKTTTTIKMSRSEFIFHFAVTKVPPQTTFFFFSFRLLLQPCEKKNKCNCGTKRRCLIQTLIDNNPGEQRQDILQNTMIISRPASSDQQVGLQIKCSEQSSSTLWCMSGKESERAHFVTLNCCNKRSLLSAARCLMCFLFI